MSVKRHYDLYESINSYTDEWLQKTIVLLIRK